MNEEQRGDNPAAEGQPATESDIAVYEAQRAHELELNKATAAFEHALVSPLFLLNGGGAVAFLTLLGAASANDSNLRINYATGTAAVGFWALGLVIAAIGVRKGYRSQQQYSRAVSTRRQLLEHALLGKGSRLIGQLREPPTKSPEDIRKDAEKLQEQWLALSALALGLFVLGVGLSAVSILQRV